ncbi:serine/threonine-protein kinase [Aquipseudomonas ullengensis]|uniref:Serine/threonine protein kinase n=1 Tax=Aquipseudomonas ullengensis TaxID=2759166 RepID=A0A7W4LJH7_9GAMM|nr:serine/threonine-protein kinase [Pseudomonas ullengensis]MBB2494261.1 serine/threonine protein kinase [Pseudomonas ullengensis]
MNPVLSPDLTLMAGSAPARAPRPLPKDLPDVLCGRYRIERLLGVGGMGAVYRARDLLREQFGDPQPYVALKTLSEDFASYPDASALLYSEFALTARLSQRNLVRLYSFEIDPASQRAFITMELLKGCTLDSLLLQYPSGLPWAEAHTVSLNLLEALQHAHSHGVLHGDLKPSNLMLGDSELRLFDFGLGQALDGFLTGLPRLSRQRFAAWTPRYAAPELLDGASLSAAADVYSVACVIYELCSGQHPFRRQSAKQAKAMELPLNAPADLPRPLWPALRAALAFDPTQRSSLPSLLQAFRAARQPTSRLPRWLRRPAT